MHNLICPYPDCRIAVTRHRLTANNMNLHLKKHRDQEPIDTHRPGLEPKLVPPLKSLTEILDEFWYPLLLMKSKQCGTSHRDSRGGGQRRQAGYRTLKSRSRRLMKSSSQLHLLLTQPHSHRLWPIIQRTSSLAKLHPTTKSSRSTCSPWI